MKSLDPVLLVVDDEPTNIAVLAQALDGLGTVKFALNGEDALTLMASHPAPSLVLLDVMMPGLGGIEVCRRLQADARWREVPVIFVSAATDMTTEIEGLEAGAVDYIHKPFNHRLVRRRVEAHLRRSMAEAERRVHARRLEAIAAVTTDLMYEWDIAADRLQLYAPGGWDEQRRIAPERAAREMTLSDWVRGIHPDDRRQAGRLRELATRETDEVVELKYRVLDDDGTTRVFVERAQLVRLDGPGSDAVVGSCVDVTAAEATARELALAKWVYGLVDDGLILTSLDGTVEQVNPAVVRSLLCEEARLLGTHVRALFADEPPVTDRIFRTLLSRRRWEGVVTVRRRNGTAFEARLVANAITDTYGKALRYVWVLRSAPSADVGRDDVRSLAAYDAVTGAENRFMFRASLHRALNMAERREQPCALYCVHVPVVSTLDDQLGVGAGDQALRTLADRLHGSVRAVDHVAWVEQGRFGVLVHAVERERVETVALRMLEELERPFSVRDHEVIPDPRIASGVFPDDGGDVRQLRELVMAQTASMATAGYAPARPRDEVTDADQARLLEQLTDVLYSGRGLQWRYQPIVDLQTGRYEGGEALLRWDHPERGLLAPGTFFAVADRGGLSIAIGERMLDRALADYAQMRPWVGDDFRLTVNLSRRQLHDAGCVRRVADALARHRLPGKVLVFDVPEAAMHTDFERTVEVVEELATLGTAVAIDDFGTGCSVLSYVHQLRTRQLKLDGTLLADLGRHAGAYAIAKAVVALATRLGAETVAEGVETEAQHAALLAMGCRLGQGRALAPEVPLDALLRDLARQAGR